MVVELDFRHLQLAHTLSEDVYIGRLLQEVHFALQLVVVGS